MNASSAEQPQYLQVRNWEQFQNADVFKKSSGRPPWIKLYQSVLDDPELEDLTNQQLGALVRVWLWAARLGNRIPASRSWWRTHLGRSGDATCTLLVQRGFLETYGNAQKAPANQDIPSTSSRDNLTSLSRQDLEVEEEKDLDLGTRPKSNSSSSPNGNAAHSPAYRRAENLIRNGGHALTDYSLKDELTTLGLSSTDQASLLQLADTLRAAATERTPA